MRRLELSVLALAAVLLVFGLGAQLGARHAQSQSHRIAPTLRGAVFLGYSPTGAPLYRLPEGETIVWREGR